MRDAYSHREHSMEPASRGIHHLALNTDDMKLTIDFYHHVLRMPLMHALRVPSGINRGNPPFENLRHYFFDAGGDTVVAFFELPKGKTPFADRNAVAAMQHCAFTITEARFDDMVTRLKEANVEMIGPLDVGYGTRSVYFIDPNGTRMEFNAQTGDGDDVRVIKRWTQSAAEIREDLCTLSDDAEWLDSVTKHLPA